MNTESDATWQTSQAIVQSARRRRIARIIDELTGGHPAQANRG
jgi:hypothetical protein